MRILNFQQKDSSGNPYRKQGKGQKAWEQWETTCERLNIVVDSGASTCILPAENAKDYPLLPRTTDRTYTSATKTQVTPVGEKRITIGVMNGDSYDSVWGISDVHRPLFAVSKMVAKNKRVVFDAEERGGSWIYDYGTGKNIQMYERDEVHIMPAWVKPRGEAKGKGFQRQA